MTHSSNNTPTKLPPITRENCGTNAGYQSHLLKKETVCTECRDARNAYKRAYDKAHPKKKRDTEKRYRLKYPKKRNQWDKKYRDNNKNKTKEAIKLWENKNPEKVKEKGVRNSRKRRARVRGNECAPYTEVQVFELYGKNCHICQTPIDLTVPRKVGKPGWKLGLHIDHVIPIIAGGPDTLENVRPAHAICNLKKGTKMTNDFEEELDPSLFEYEDVELEDLDLEDFEDDEEEEEN